MQKKVVSKDSNLIRIFTGAAVTLVGQLCRKFSLILIQLVIARLYGRELFGVYVICLAFISVTELFCQFGLKTGGMKYVAAHLEKNALDQACSITSFVLSMSFLLGIVVGIIGYCLTPYIGPVFLQETVHQRYLAYMFIALPFSASSTVILGVTHALKTTAYRVVIDDIVSPVTNLGFILLFWTMGFGVEGVIYSFVINSIVIFVLSVIFFVRAFSRFFIIRFHIPKFSKSTRELMVFSFSVVFNNVLHFALSNTDILMLGMYTNSLEVGLYRAASQIALLVPFFLGSFSVIYAPTIAVLIASNDRESIGRYFLVVTRWISISSVLLFLCILLFKEELLGMYGEGFVSGTHILGILALGFLFHGITGPSGSTLTMINKQKIELINSLALIILNIILNMILIRKMGALGSSIATATSIVMINVLRIIELYYFLRIWPYSISSIKPFVTALFIYILVKSIKDYIHFDSYIFTGALCAFTVLLYSSIIYFLLDEEEKSIVEWAREKLKIWNVKKIHY